MSTAASDSGWPGAGPEAPGQAVTVTGGASLSADSEKLAVIVPTH